MSKRQADIHPTEADRRWAKAWGARAITEMRLYNLERGVTLGQERALKDLEKRLREEGRS